MSIRKLLLTAAPILALAQFGAARAQNMKLDRLTGGEEALAKINTPLLELRRAELDGDDPRSAARRLLAGRLRGDALQVNVVHSGDGVALEAFIRSLGIEVYRTFPAHHTITIRTAGARELEPVARRPDVRRIDPEPIARLQSGSVTTQGDAAMRADAARSLGLTGAGVKVGILSDSIHRVIGGTLAGQILTGSAAQDSGDLPAQVRVIEEGPPGSSDEGAAMAEIVHDIAPGAQIVFASAFNSYLGFAANITNLVNAGCNVIVDDVIYLQEPMYQDGPVAESVRKAVEAGVACFSAAGNNGNLAHEAPFKDRSGTNDAASPPSGKDLHDFGGGDSFLRVRIPQGASLAAVLHWDDPYGGGAAQGPGATCDLDLYLVKSTSTPLTGSNIVASSTSNQGTISNPGGDAIEAFQFDNTSSTTTYHLVIDRYNDPPAARDPGRVSLIIFTDGRSEVVDTGLIGARTIYGHSTAPGAVAVAAMFFAEMADRVDPVGGVIAPAGQYDVESYSALGGALPFYYTAQGAPLENALTRVQPLITAPDGGNTSFFGGDFDSDGFPNFFGTSAAAPHAAAVAALMLERNRLLKPAKLEELMTGSAVDSESPGFDSLSGAGWVDAFKAVQADSADPLAPGIPQRMITAQRIPVSITAKNAGTSIWTRAEGFQLGITGDPCGLFEGVTRVPFPEGTDNILPNLAVTFQTPLAAPDQAGLCGFSFRMVHEGTGFFGPELTGQVEVASAFEADLAAASAGWFGGVVAGGTSVTRGPAGLCMTVPGPGDNIAGWVSPERFVPLKDLTVFRARVTASTSQSAVDAIPVWTLVYDNFPYLTYGGETLFIDVAGGANGIGRPQGRTGFEIWAMPNAARAPQWRGTLSTGAPGENDASAFTPAADTQNDMRLTLRQLDIAGAGVNSALDSGQICVRSLRIDAVGLGWIAPSDTVFAPGLSNQTHGAETFDQQGAGLAQIDDGAATANFQLLASGLGSRKTLFPWDQTGGAPAPFHPAVWTGDSLYRGVLRIRSNLGGTVEGVDPVDTITLAFDTRTIELVTTAVTLRGTPGAMRFAASPRLASTAGGAQTYEAYFFSHNRTALDPGIDPEAPRWRMLGDFANYPEIAPEGQGADPFSVEEMRIERVTAP